MRKLCLDITFHIKTVDLIRDDNGEIPSGHLELPATAIKSAERELENMFIGDETISSDVRCVIHRAEVVDLGGLE